MKFIFEIIFCIGAAYGIGWFFSSYYRPVAHEPGAFNGPNCERRNSRGLTLVKRVQTAESALPGRPARDRSWLS